jgi:hypothetical protein
MFDLAGCIIQQASSGILNPPTSDIDTSHVGENEAQDA